jgi:hypothetical protein
VKKDEAVFLEIMLNGISAQVTTDVKAPALLVKANVRTSSIASEYGLLVQRAEVVRDYIAGLILEVKQSVEKSFIEKISRAEIFDWDRKLTSLETKLIDCRYVAQRLQDQKIVDVVNKIINHVGCLREYIKSWW